MPVVRVSWFEGKDPQVKKAVAAEITESIVKNTGAAAEYIYVLFEDVAPSNRAGAGEPIAAQTSTNIGPCPNRPAPLISMSGDGHVG